jgi:glyoxylase-like metal-dependent hydrolase (beta-lactamase superfamily II)
VLGWSWTSGFVFGLCLSVASTVVLLRSLEDRGLLGSVDGALSFGPPAFTADAVRSRASLERVARMGVDRLLFSHGAEVPDPCDRALDFIGSSV